MKRNSSIGSEIEITLPAEAAPEELRRTVARKSGSGGPFRIIRQSLDARHKPDIRWNYRIAIGSSPAPPEPERVLPVIRKRGAGRAVVVGSGPAGFFAADILNRAGWRVTLLEQGPPVEERKRDIVTFETGGPLAPSSNYAFGEGGAGTFSDGKLTSRTRQISREREYVTARYVQYGAPAEIQWLAHPHIGSDNLYHYTGKLTGDYDVPDSETGVFDMLLTGEQAEARRHRGAQQSGRVSIVDQNGTAK